ncbi:MAG: S53 family peptidase, partial [Verrucomicrobiota bacterium]|nr:S53 family peptidase [Verrucomicrobiota bacterium]
MKKKTTPARVALPASHRAPPVDAKLAGKISDDERLEVTIRLRRKATAGRPKAGAKPLSREDFRANYGADPADVEKVEQFANEHGLDVMQTSISQRSVRLSGTVAAMQTAFGVRFRAYKSERTKATFRGRTGKVTVPRELGKIVEAVFGLDNRPQACPHFRIRPGRSSIKSLTATAKSMTPTRVAELYNFPPKLNGRGQCIAIIELGGGFRAKDLSAYFMSLGITKQPSVTAVSVNGGHNEPDGPTSDSNDEVMLDIEVAGAVAPGAKIAVYFAPNTDEGFLGALTNAIHDSVRKPSVISISWGSAEKDWTQQAMTDFDRACIDATAMGVTITAAAGDHGAPDTDDPSEKRANADFPASSPNVLACGGTRLIGDSTGITSETVWNDHDGWATGGGVSEIFPLPDYQKNACVPKSINPGGKIGRGVPDVCGNADSETGYQVLVDGTPQVIGGTSAVAPLWAGLIARLNQGRAQPLGFVTPKLYALKP